MGCNIVSRCDEEATKNPRVDGGDRSTIQALAVLEISH